MIKPNFIFTDNAVLQREKEVVIFGECNCSEITVKYAKYCVPAKIVGNSFEARIPPMPANICDELIFEAEEETICFKNVVTGDVWLAAGQSNMEHPTFCTYYDESILENNSQIRLFTVPRRPFKDAKVWGWHFNSVYSEDTPWVEFNKKDAMSFSAVAINFVKNIIKEITVPIGIISCNRGGTDMESWISRNVLLENKITRYMVDEYDRKFSDIDMTEYQRKYNEYQKDFEQFLSENDNEFEMVRRLGVDSYLKNHSFKKPIPEGPYDTQVPGVCWDNMIKRIIPFSIAGVLWYQGESNTRITPFGHKDYFIALMNTLINEWRKAFEDSNLPFYTVQLAMYQSIGEDKKNWAEVRFAQEEISQKDNIYLVTAIDIGQKNQIHPANKKLVGERLAKTVLANYYGIDLEWKSPKIFNIIKNEGKIILEFENVREFMCLNKNTQSFFITDLSGKESKINVKIEKNKILYEMDKKCAKIGYCNRNYSVPDLYNENGLPLLPFEIDV